MKAYSKSITKTEFLRELKAHQKADNFRRVGYWNGSKGCAVGCSLESVGRLKGVDLDKSNHSLYPVHLGIPEWLARLEDVVFENVSVERSKTWPVEFAEAIKTGANLEKAKRPIIIMLLEHTLVSMEAVKYDEAANPQVKAVIEQSKAAVKQMIKAQKSGKGIESASARSASAAARSAARSAEAAAWSAEAAARSAEAGARSAEAAARSAEAAAWSAEAAAWSAEAAARSASAAAWSAEAAAWSFGYYADRILEILRKCT